MEQTTTAHPILRMRPREDARIRRGHPWAFANELVLDDAARALAPGAVATLASSNGAPLGTVTFNVHSLIAARVWDRWPDAVLDREWFSRRIARALALRERFFERPYYRLIHAEGDGLPGVVVDRFGDALVVQTNTTGAEGLLDPLLGALDRALSPTVVVLRNDSPSRDHEGLPLEVRVAVGELGGPVEVPEGDCRFLADLVAGQKTGWFYDLADARALVARLAAGRDVLDLCCHSGPFAIRAAKAGAASVLGIDRSETALALAESAAQSSGVEPSCRFVCGDLFKESERLGSGEKRFGLVVADPPSFVKSKRELKSGLRGYRKLARLTSRLVEPGGFLFVASCAHHVPAGSFGEEVAHGLAAAGRIGRVIATGGAGPDHPVHAMLPETAYLKWRLLQID